MKLIVWRIDTEKTAYESFRLSCIGSQLFVLLLRTCFNNSPKLALNQKVSLPPLVLWAVYLVPGS